MQILKHSKSKCVDTDLAEIIQVVKCNTMHISDVNSVDDAIYRTMSMTTVHVGEALMRQERLLLHAFFLREMKACVNIHTSEKEQVLTARWVLSNLYIFASTAFKLCVQNKKCGNTSNGDIPAALTNALHRFSHSIRPTSVESNSEGEGSAKTHVTDCRVTMTSFFSHMVSGVGWRA